MAVLTKLTTPREHYLSYFYYLVEYSLIELLLYCRLLRAMFLDFRNINTLWTSVLAETLSRLGVKIAVICPGSRSAPLAVAFAQHAQIEAIPILDERSASFFALGIARQSGQPAALICTSGTAGANFYPAVIEAHQSRVPLLILTGDRPPELRDCQAGQTVDQQKLFGTYPNWYHELATPTLSLPMLAYLRQTLIHAWERSQHPIPGPVHLNLPFRDPLAPLPQAAVQAFADEVDQEWFFADVGAGGAARQQEMQEAGWSGAGSGWPMLPPLPAPGILIAGPAQPRSPQRYCEAIAKLSRALGFPVLAEALSPLRNYASLHPYLISTYDLILRDRALAIQLAPATVIRIGELPTSKELRGWLEQTQPQQWIVGTDSNDGSTYRNLDPLHLRTHHLHCSVEQLVASIDPGLEFATPQLSSYLKLWCSTEAQMRCVLHQSMSGLEPLIEGKAAWLLSQCLPPGTPLFIANSTPIRFMEWFWQPGDRAIQPFFNRGANGIDGTLSTALGIAHRQQSSVLLTGDLAFLHDTNGLLLRSHFAGHLTIVLLNNNGGGIFETLPIAQFDPPFEDFFATPQHISFAALCATYDVEYESIESWDQLTQRLSQLPTQGIRVLELKSDRKANARWLKTHLNQWANKTP